MIDNKWLRGCDLSHWNNKHIYDVATKELDFFILKMTEGTNYVDYTFADRFNDLITRGKCVGVYHFWKEQDVNEQFYNIRKNLPTTSIPIFLDIETPIISWHYVRDLVRKITNYYNRRPVLYMSKSVYDKCPKEIKNDNLFWVARYKKNGFGATDLRFASADSSSATFWREDKNIVAFQTADTMFVDGEQLLLDSDYFKGTYNDFMKVGCNV